ncbi:MAG: hypothetical protein ABIH26_08250 [Candidatus Eisenbacteria bacterium]
MTDRTTIEVRRGLVADPGAKHFHAVKQAVWLYLYLLVEADPDHGDLILDPARAATETGFSEATLRSWLGHLRKAGYLSARQGGGGLRIRILRWHRALKSLESSQKPRKAAQEPRSGDGRTPIPSQVLQDPEKVLRALEDPGDGEEAVQAALATYPKEALERAFLVAAQVSPAKIRKSRTALFLYLVKKYAQET